jgi:hypothetical protein
VTLALIITILIAAGLIVALVAEETNRREWKRHDAELERRVAVDEALLEQLRGPRRTADQVRGEGR